MYSRYETEQIEGFRDCCCPEHLKYRYHVHYFGDYELESIPEEEEQNKIDAQDDLNDKKNKKKLNKHGDKHKSNKK